MKSEIQKINSKNNNIYIKRDDLLGYSFGGNKLRKAINFFKEIDLGNYDCVVTYGSSSSNHCRIIANMAKERNIECYIISPKESSKETLNSKIIKNFRAEIIIVPVEEVKYTIDHIMKELKHTNKTPYFIQGGGHGNLGTKAYIETFDEIQEYEKKEKIKFDYIFLASGTGTTQAGLICGKVLNNSPIKIIGISVARRNPYGRYVVLESVYDYLNESEIEYEKESINDHTIFLDDYIIDGYGSYNEEIEKIISNMMSTNGIPLDPTYTGKAYYGMNKYIDQNNISDKNILFIHTGGTPLYFDYLDKRGI